MPFYLARFKGGLAVNERLFYRHITANKICQVNYHEEETILHTLFHCNYAQKIWESDYGDKLLEAPDASFSERLGWMAQSLDRQALSIFTSLFWASWHCRHITLFELTIPDAVRVTTGFAALVTDYNNYASCVYGHRVAVRCPCN